MKPIKATLLLLILSCSMITVIAQQKYSQVKIYNDPRNPYAQRDFVFGDLQVDHCHFDNGAYVVEIGAAEMAKLKASSYRYEILVDDVAENFRRTSDVSKFYDADQKASQNRAAFVVSCQQSTNLFPTPAAFTPGSMGGYYTYAEMITKINSMKATYPAIVDTFTAGFTHEGRRIIGVKISDNVKVDEPESEVLINGLQHCREAIAGSSLIFLMQYLTENYATNSRVQQIVNSREIYIIPCVNVDGYVFNESTDPAGGGMWRKNRRDNLDGTFGVDLNRNYNIDFGNCNTPVAGVAANCGSWTTSSDSYFGPSAFSEPETQAIRNFTYAHNFKLSIDQHSEGAYNTVPNGRVSLHPSLALIDSQFLYGFASSMMATYDCHRIGNNLQTLNYEVAGGNKDWMLNGDLGTKRSIYSFTSEAGGGSFWPAAAQIIPLCKGLCFQDLQAIITAGGYADLQDMNDVVLAGNGTMNYQVRRIGVIDAPITVTLIPLENIATTGPPVVIPTIAAYHSTVSGGIAYTLPGSIAAGQRVRFVWRVLTDGITTFDTVTKFYNPTTIFYDDMETGAATANWTVTGGWAYSATQAFAGTKSFTESPAGNYTAGSTRNATYINTIDLSNATAAYLSFWVKHRSENCLDFLRIQISTNGGGSYTNLCGKLTIAENAGTLGGQPALTGIREDWSRELVDLSGFIGAGMNNIKLRFQFVSNANDPADPYYKQQDDGFSLDNIRLMKSTSALLFTLPVHFLSFEGSLLSNGTAELKWEAETDGMHDHFEVQRSGDGVSFSTIGNVTTAPPCKFIDGNVQSGKNYYRIKQVDKDGHVTYSKVITIYYNPGKSGVAIYPNPVTSGILKVSLTGNNGDFYTVTLNDVFGKRIYNEKIIVGNTPRIVDINLGDKSSQVFILTVRNNRNELIATEKILKN